jgi:hypothetical protein
MNIFVLDQNPYRAAESHCDKHIVKMILEYGQMLSTAHRLCDGQRQEWVVTCPSTGRSKKLQHWLLPGEKAAPALEEKIVEAGRRAEKLVVRVDNEKCYKVAHANHPCSIWARQTDANYHWLFQLFDGCNREYTRRYGRQHLAHRLFEFLSVAPKNIKSGVMTPFAQAMPDEYKHEDAVEAYRRFYAGAKSRFAKWRYSQPPRWYPSYLERKSAASFT